MNKKVIAEIEALHGLLESEREADREVYQELMSGKTIKEREEEGVCWYPLQVTKTGYALGEHAFVVLERDKPQRHRFRPGDSVRFFINDDHVQDGSCRGIIRYVERHKMKVILNSRDLPEWLNLGKLGVDLLFDDRSYKEMEKALNTLQEIKQGRLADLRNILMGFDSAVFNTRSHEIELPNLNSSQNKAINSVLSAKDVALVHGPPGTGKTTTIVQAIKISCSYENTILVCAPSNAATDLLTERLAEKGLNVVRIGNISRIDESIIEHTLDGKLSKHPESKNIKKVKQEAAECRKKAGKFKRKFGAKERAERDFLYKESRELMSWAKQLEERLVDQVLSSAQVITSTLVGAANSVLEKREFQSLFIDEAAQALEPACWIPILKAKRVIFAGDPFQLPPTVKSRDAQKGGLGITLMEKVLKQLPEVCLLRTQYRMNERIMGFSNQQFYEGKLLADVSVSAWKLQGDEGSALEFVDTAGCGFEEQLNKESKYNPGEYNILREHLYQLLEMLEEGEEQPSIGLISPYKEQVRYLTEEISNDEKLSELEGLSINTIDAFQGQERDIIYISLVRSNEKGIIGFLSDTRRMNVALTRAKKKLVVIGDSATLGKHKFYEDFLIYCENNEAYKSAWEYMI